MCCINNPPSTSPAMNDQLNFYLIISSVVIGLGITHALNGYANLFKVWGDESRPENMWMRSPRKQHTPSNESKNYWLIHVWAIIGVFSLLQYWVGIWNFRSVIARDLSMGKFVLTVLPMICLYMAMVVIVPAERSEFERIDLRRHYEKYRRTLASLACAVTITYFVYGIVVIGHSILSLQSLARLVFSALFASLLWGTEKTFSRRYHEWIGCLILIAYAALVFLGVFQK